MDFILCDFHLRVVFIQGFAILSTIQSWISFNSLFDSMHGPFRQYNIGTFCLKVSVKLNLFSYVYNGERLHIPWHIARIFWSKELKIFGRAPKANGWARYIGKQFFAILLMFPSPAALGDENGVLSNLFTSVISCL